MTREKLLCCLGFLLALFEGHCSLNTTQPEEVRISLNATVNLNESSLAGTSRLEPSGTTEAVSADTSTSSEPKGGQSEELIQRGMHSNKVNQSELVKIFSGVTTGTNATGEETVDRTMIRDCMNRSSVNETCLGQSWNETAKTNYTVMAEAVEAVNSVSPFRLEKSAAIAAGIFLVSAIFGYISCVGYRRFLQRKYGNSQVLIAEEVYDTTDLRYFEI